MVSTNIRDLLTTFSPSLDYLAISSGDGRIKIWDTVKGQVQTEFSNITPNDTNLFAKSDRGHLSVDYTCMKWLSLDRKKKRKLGSSFLVLGTGSGDVLAFDVTAGQLKWIVSDCHPGGVSAVSFSTHESCIYTAGTDGMICKIDSETGNISGKFKASTKAILCMAVSPDGKSLAIAAGQLKVFSCSDFKKIQKFSGHPGAVHSMVFTEDGKHILSSASGERYVAVWRIDGGKKQSASCVLAMEHPAVFLDSRCFKSEGFNDGLYVMAISETGVCYTWCGRNIEELRNARPTKVFLSYEESFSKNYKGPLPTIFAAKMQGTAKPMAAHIFIAYGLLVKPSFQKILVHSGTDIKLSISLEGVLLPVSQSLAKSKKSVVTRSGVTALDRGNAEDALLPLPQVSDLLENKIRNEDLYKDADEIMADLIDRRGEAESADAKDGMAEAETLCIEKQLRLLKVLSCADNSTVSMRLDSAKYKGIDLEANIPPKKMRAAVLSMEPSKAYELLEVLVDIWQSRSCSGKLVLPWIYCILVNHGHYIMAQEKTENQMLNSLLKITNSRGAAIQPLLRLSGRLQLLVAQIDNAALNKNQPLLNNDQMDDNKDDNEEDDDHLYGADNEESELSSDNE